MACFSPNDTFFDALFMATRPYPDGDAMLFFRRLVCNKGTDPCIRPVLGKLPIYVAGTADSGNFSVEVEGNPTWFDLPCRLYEERRHMCILSSRMALPWRAESAIPPLQIIPKSEVNKSLTPAPHLLSPSAHFWITSQGVRINESCGSSETILKQFYV
jgi:hypothetical protein